tara:strand:+ start:1418 stop:2512 length:1095 start_codon:yes stop_codon:yes gene_type:complete
MVSLGNEYIKIVSSSELEKLNLIKPEIQRIINKCKVEEIVSFQLNLKKTYNRFNISPSGPINIYILDDKYFLLDGQHRVTVIGRLYRDYSHEIKFFVKFTNVNSIEELEEHYKIINSNTPLPDFSNFQNINIKIPELVSARFQEVYPSIWSKNSRARRPHLYFNYFQEALAFICNELNIKDSKELLGIVLDFNKILSGWDYSSFKVSENVYNSAKEKKIYLGLYSYENEKYVYWWAKKIVENRTGKTIKKMNKFSSKKGIPKKIKNDSWDRYIGRNVGIAPCICCRSEKIEQKKFTAGHIISEYNGGTITVDNIIPICDSCNLSMGTRNMDLFIKEHYPKNFNKFANRDYSDGGFLTKIGGVLY